MKAHCRVAFFVATMLLPTAAWATAQISDKIIIEGEIQRLYANPLEQYFSGGHEKPRAFIGGMMSTACRRGYVATWEIRQGKLYLNKLEKEYPSGEREDHRTEWRELPLTTLFPESTGPVHADWYSGTLRIPQGKRLKYVHMGYASVYEKEVNFKISKGIVRGIRDTDYGRLLAEDGASKTIELGCELEMLRYWRMLSLPSKRPGIAQASNPGK